jgi:hypothetical protein
MNNRRASFGGFPEELFAVAEAEQEHEPVQVVVQLVDAAGVVSDVGGQVFSRGCFWLLASQWARRVSSSASSAVISCLPSRSRPAG